MISRLVLGCGAIGHAVVDALADRPGTLRVVESDASRIETLRNEGIAATRGDVTDSAALADVQRSAEFVAVLGDDPGVNRAAVRAVRETFPDAYLVTYPGVDATADDYAAAESAADRVIDPGAAVLDHATEAITTGTNRRTHELRTVVEAVDGTLGVFMHDNPDPDAIASGVALVRIAESVGTPAEACYYGEISHQENRALVNLLDFELRNLDPADPLEYDGIALVDHSEPGVNDQLPPTTDVDIVIDHHPAETVEATFVDHREDVGATSTLLADYVRQFGIDVEGSVATGLLYGIRVDTQEFSREITPEDFEAAAYLLPYADQSVLEQVESPNMSPDTLDTIARAVTERRLNGSTLVSCVGAISDRDTLAQAADRLLAMQGVTTTLVCGFLDGTIYASARSRDTDVDLGTVLREAFSGMGSAGGHADMAGAQIPLGLLGEVEDQSEASLSELIADVLTQRFFAEMRDATAT